MSNIIKQVLRGRVRTGKKGLQAHHGGLKCYKGAGGLTLLPSLLLPLPKAHQQEKLGCSGSSCLCLHLQPPTFAKPVLPSLGTSGCPVFQPSRPRMLAKPDLGRGQCGGRRFFCLIPSPSCLVD